MPGREPLDRLNCFYLLCEGKSVCIYILMFYEGIFGVLADQISCSPWQILRRIRV